MCTEKPIHVYPRSVSAGAGVQLVSSIGFGYTLLPRALPSTNYRVLWCHAAKQGSLHQFLMVRSVAVNYYIASSVLLCFTFSSEACIS